MATTATPTPIGELLKQFAKQPGCEKYKNDGERIKLLSTYFWLRQLDPALVFERFLERYALVADFDEENRKHPEDALRFHCPRSKAEAEKRQRPQWSAKQCAGVLALYADMVREAEREGQEPPLTLDQFLGELGEAYLNGEFDVGPETAPAANDNGQLPLPLVSEDPPPLPATTPVVSPAIPAGRPSAAGQMVTAELAPGGREIRGTTLAVYEVEGRWYCDLRSTDGEEFRGLAVGSCRLDVPDTSTQAAVQQTAADESPLPVAESHKLWITKSQFRKVQEALALNAPMGNVAIEDAIYPYCRAVADGLEARIEVANGENGPYVDAFLCSVDAQGNDRILTGLPPRKNIEGIYDFVHDGKIYRVEVRGRS